MTVNILLLLLSLLLGFLICEVVSRLATTVDEDDQVYLKKRLLLPYRFPANMVRRKLDHFFKSRDQAYVVDDPVFGWTIAPNRKSENGLYVSNSLGIRSQPREYAFQPAPGVLRIALFGDSFTHGDEEPYDKTWGKFLEDDLKDAGISAEVINFGVGGFGIGQACLRWERLGRKFSPQIAVFGFQAENMKRAVNIFRSLYSRRTWLVFSKPRFILNPEGELELINCPVVNPEKIPQVLEHFQQSPLAEYEFWYNPENYRDSFWFKSRFIQILYNKFRKPQRDYKDYSIMEKAGGVPEDVSLAILRRFVREVEETGATPIILHILKKSHLKLIWKGITPAYYSLFRELEKEGVIVVNPDQKMKGKSRCYKRSHFSSKGGRIVARELADGILAILAEKDLLSKYEEVPVEKAGSSADRLIQRYRDADKLFVDIGRVEDREFIQDGFHARERHINRTPVRWTRQTAVLLLPLIPREGKKPVLRLRIADTGPKRQSAEARVSVDLNGRQIGQISLHQGEDTYRLELPTDIKEPGMATVTIISPAWQPSRLLRTRDPRELGVMLDWVILEYE